MQVGATAVGGRWSARWRWMQARAHDGSPSTRAWATPPVEAADPGGRWRIRTRTVASVGVFLRQCALGKAELWSHNVNDTQSGPASSWRPRPRLLRCRVEICFNDDKLFSVATTSTHLASAQQIV
jgi:hypothetical protein